ncbi:MAG: hypothetical protein LUD69_04635 [Oscillospiraceae bacterium]|nr:hypothetical protein [Oscillospiraceae bacterium]
MFFLVSVIVVVGGMFLLRRIYYSYEDSKRHQRATQTKNTAVADFKWAHMLACNEDIEREARVNATSVKGEEMRDEIRKAIDFNPTTQMIFLGLMAEKAKIPLDVMKYGISYWYPYNWDADTRDATLAAVRRFLVWYDQKLQAHQGFNADLRLVPNEVMKRCGEERLLISLPVAEIEQHIPIGGVCCWSFNVYTIDEYQAFKLV